MSDKQRLLSILCQICHFRHNEPPVQSLYGMWQLLFMQGLYHQVSLLWNFILMCMATYVYDTLSEH